LLVSDEACETSHLLELPEAGGNSIGLRAKTPWLRRSSYVVIAVSFLSAIVLVAYMASPSWTSGVSATKLSTFEQKESLALSLSNEYPPQHESVKLYGWEHIVEPYRETTLAISGSVLSSSSYAWNIFLEEKPEERPEVVRSGETEVVVMFTKPGRFYTVQIEETGENGETIVHKFQVICKYIRREIRALNTEDKEKFFDALEQFHSLTMEEGQELYGEKFYNAKDLSIRHMATVDGCSPWHGGVQFLPTHMAFTLHLEQVLQMIEPSIALPYWNYPSDADKYGPGAWTTESELFSEEYFGAFTDSPVGALEGRWASLPVGVITDPSEMDTEHNSFGIITPYYNQNPSVYLTRSSQFCGWTPQKINMPTCSDESSVLSSGANGLTDLFVAVDRYLHGVQHSLIGGAWKCAIDVGAAIQEFEGNDQVQLIYETMLMNIEAMWERGYDDGYYSTPALTQDTDQGPSSFEDARLTLSDIELDAIDSMSFDEVYKYLDTKGFFGYWAYDDFGTATCENGYFQFNGVDDATNETLLRSLLKLVSTVGALSPYASPWSAAADPLFGLTHSMWNRHYSYVRLANPDFDSSWTSTTSSCWGFHADDVMVWKGFQGEEDSEAYFYTEQELVELFAPDNAALPYIHDNLDFSTCTVH